jgi:hypothetical protein
MCPILMVEGRDNIGHLGDAVGQQLTDAEL